MYRALCIGIVVSKVARYLGPTGAASALEVVCKDMRAHFNSRLRLEMHLMHKRTQHTVETRTVDHRWQWTRKAYARWEYLYYCDWEYYNEFSAYNEDCRQHDEYYRGRVIGGWGDDY